jgi:hypothetical protein
MSDEALTSRLADLSPEARASLRRRLANRRVGAGRVIPARRPDEPVPMSFAQWRLWFLEQLRPGTNAWNTPIALTLYGSLDVEVLRRSLQLLVQRHATLRTVFPVLSGVPAPVLLDSEFEFELPVISAEDVQGEDLQRTVQEFVREEVARPFDLESDLMLRARLLRVASDQHVIVLVAHHIACDGWSKGLLLDELGTAYEALCAGEVPALSNLPIEYADFAIWQRRSLHGETLEGLAAYWKGALSGARPALELTTDYPRPATQGFRGAVEWLTVPASVAESVLALGRQERATPFMTLMTAFMTLLCAHSGQDDVLVGSPSAMRTHPELERMIGLFANTLVYRTSLAGRPSFRDLVGRVRETAVGAYEHQDMPFEKVVEAVRPPRDASRNPLVQVNMRVEGREPELRLGRLRSEPISIDPGIARFDLAIELGVTNDGFAGYLEYDTALFQRTTAAAFADGFVSILEACATAPDRPLEALEPVQAIRERGVR